MYKVLTSYELVCASYDHIYVYCLRPFVVVYIQTCNFVLMFMLMKIVFKVLTSSELVYASYDHINFMSLS